MEKTEIIKKLKKILWQLLEPNFKIKNGHYLNLLLSHWNSKTENDSIKMNNFKQELNEIFCQWIIAAINIWIDKINAPSAPVLAFALNVGCQLSKDELFFNRFKNENLYGILAEVAKENEQFDACNNAGFIMLLSSVLEHPSGVQWLLNTSYWNNVVEIALTGQTKYIKQKAYQFIIKLLETTILLDKDFCEELVEILVEPIIEAAVRSEFIKESEAGNCNVNKSLKPILDLVSEVADTLLKKLNTNVLNLFLETEVGEAIQNIFNFSQQQDLCFNLLKIRFVFLFAHLCGKLEKNKKVAHDADTLFDIGIMFDLIKAEIEKDHVRCAINICYYANVLYCNLNNHIPLCIRKGEEIKFDNQMILIQLVPVMILGQQFLGTPKRKQLAFNDELRQSFHVKLAKISAIKTIEITARWEQRLSTKIDLIEDVTLDLQYIVKSKEIMKKEQAAIIFQSLIYSLQDSVYHLATYRERNMPIREVRYFKMLVNTIIDLVKSFDLTWKDSIEIMAVLDLAFDIVQYDYADYEVTANFLKLLNMGISRCMSPNMLLLTVNTNDTVMSQVGSLLYSKYHNRSYEVRSNALEVVHTIAINASTKFPEFTNALFNAELPKLILNLALGDRQHEVRGTALKCIQALILLENIYEVYQSKNNFWDTILNILINDPMGTVRKEAAILLLDIMKRYNFPKHVLPRLYDAMTHAAIADTHWEVKLNAVSFFCRTIENHFQAQGMSDRKFPEYTFSKKKKKIVNLNKKEIRKLSIEVLNQVSNIGTTYVLNASLQNTLDEEVMKFSKQIASQMTQLCRVYKINPDDADLDEPPCPIENDTYSNSVSTSSGEPSPGDSCSTNSHPSPTPSDNDFSPSNGSPKSCFLALTPLDNYSNTTEGNIICNFESSTSSNNQSSFKGKMDLDNLQSQHPSFSDLFDLDYSISYDDNYTALSTFSTSNSSYSNKTSSYDKTHTLDKWSFNITEEMESMASGTSSSANDIFVSECDINLAVALTENMENSINADITETGDLFEELLKFSDSTLPGEIITDAEYQVKSPKVIKTRQYLPPSAYVRSCLQLAETAEKESSKLAHDYEAFDILLNELSKEYDMDLAT